jgi:YndJ-like protein
MDLNYFISTSYRSVSRLGLLLWLGVFVDWRPDLHHDVWARLILLMAVLIWVPMVLNLLEYPKAGVWWVGLSGLALVAGFYCEAGWLAAGLALPWVVVTLWVFMRGVDHWIQHAHNAGEKAVAASQIFLVVGGLWTLADRLGWQPLGFDPVIVLLTGVHFHYAGFLFTWLAGRSAQQWPHQATNTAAYLAMLAVPLTAAGITVTQLWGRYELEALSALCVAVSGWLMAASYFLAVLRPGLPLLARLLWLICSVSLIFSMTLAVGYAVRNWWPVEWLAIPNMRAWHGTSNALGVAGCGVWGWWVWSGVRRHVLDV